MFSKFKIPLICAIAALLLSFIIGILSSVRFTVILLRSGILSLVSGGFAFAAMLILERFTPELFQQQNSPVQHPLQTNTEAGKNVNISIDEPIDIPAMQPVKDEEEPVLQEETVSPATAERISETDTAGSVHKNEIHVHSVDANITEKQKTFGNSSELEELPDLQEFAPAEEPQETETRDFVEEGTGRFNVSADLAGSDMDTNTMVQAIRTVLKRES